MAEIASRQDPFAELTLPHSSAFRMTATLPATRLILRGDAAVAELAGMAFGCPVPMKPMASTVTGARAVLWLGPDEWLLLADEDDRPADLVRQICKALGDRPYSLVDVSHRQVGLILEGALAAGVLGAGCPLDLRLPACPVGKVMRTLFGKTEIMLWRQSQTRFHVEVWRSFLPFLTGHLTQALRGLQ